jgi:thioredoxin reductase
MQVTDAQELVTYDVVVVGGGAAGLGGALMLGRSRRSVLVVDAGEPRNAPASAVHGFLTRDGTDPAALLEVGRAEVRGYGAQVLDGRVASAEVVDDGFAVTLEDGRWVGARRLLITTGLVDELPDVPGVRERWGRDVLHCPYCHGWEVRDQAIGILASGPMAMHQTLLFRQLTADVTLFLHTAPWPTEEEAEQLAARGIAVVKGEVASLEVREDRLTGVRMRSGELVPRSAVVVGPRFAARAGMLAGLGLETTDHPSGIGEHIEADATGLTAVPGVWVAGNVTDPTAQVLASASAGAMAGAHINADLVAEDTREAVAANQDHLSSTAGTGRA